MRKPKLTHVEKTCRELPRVDEEKRRDDKLAPRGFSLSLFQLQPLSAYNYIRNTKSTMPN